MLGKALRHPGSVRWELGDVKLQVVCGMAQVGTSRDLRVHVWVKKDFSGTSMDKATLSEGLEHGTHQ